MTNSTPKMNNKVERQASPNTSAKKRQRGGSTRTTYFSNNNKKYSSPTSQTQTQPQTPNNGNSGTRFSSSPCIKNSLRSSDSSGYSSSTSSSSSSSSSRSSGNGSPTNNFFAGSKWSDPPSPTALPQPPSHWTPPDCQQSENSLMTNHLKMILNVKA